MIAYVLSPTCPCIPYATANVLNGRARHETKTLRAPKSIPLHERKHKCARRPTS